MPTVNPSILASLQRLRFASAPQPPAPAPSQFRADMLASALGAFTRSSPAAVPFGPQPLGPMSAPLAQQRDLSLSASGSGETLVIVLAVAGAALGGAYIAGVWPFKGRKSRSRKRSR